MSSSDTSQPGLRLNADAIKHFWKPVENKLLQLGGNSAHRPESDVHIKSIFERGRQQDGCRVSVPGLPNECHVNACELWMRSSGKKSLCTGYALSDEGIWFQHSWCMSVPQVKKPWIFETTCEWEKYFGIALEDLDAFRFVFASISKEKLKSVFDKNPQMRILLKEAVERGRKTGSFRIN